MTTDYGSLKGVIESSMCIGCGVCEHADPSVRVELNPVKQMFEPSTSGGARAASVCPAVAVDFASLQSELFPGQEQTPFGVVEQILLAQSTDQDRNRRASSGGLIKEILLALLRRDDIDGVIALDHIDGLDFQPRLITSPDEVDRLPGSIYHNLAQPEALRLLRENKGRFVLVAIPCHLEGIYNYIFKLEPELRARIAFSVGLLCGWQFNHHALRAFCEFKKLPFDEITDVAYRGGGPIGKLRIQTGEDWHSFGRRVGFAYQVAFDRSFNLQRCHVCVNHTNFLADLVVGDAWLPATVTSTTGVSIVICRSQGAAQLIADLRSTDRIRTVEVGVEDLQESQKRPVVFGDTAYAYADLLNKRGEHTPDMVGPNRAAARLAAPETVERLHNELVKKRRLQQQRRYRLLYLRKATVESHRHALKYLRWFAVRVLRIKSVTGQRTEVSRREMKDFL